MNWGAEVAGALQAEVGVEVFMASFGPFDALWALLAAGMTYRLGSGNGVDD